MSEEELMALEETIDDLELEALIEEFEEELLDLTTTMRENLVSRIDTLTRRERL